MSKLISGRQMSNIYVKIMKLPIGGNMFVVAHAPFILHVEFYYESGFPDTEDEPGCAEYFELTEVKALSPIYLYNYDGLTLSISNNLNLLDILDERQYDVIVEALSRMSKLSDKDSNIWVEVL